MKIPECSDCRQCNHKGKPSVMRGSAYCDSHKIKNKNTNRLGLLQKIRDRLFENNYDEKTKQIKDIKGFRKSWIWR